MKWIWLSLLGAAGVGVSAEPVWAAGPEPSAASEPAPAVSEAAVIDAALLDADRRFVGGDLEGALRVLGPACSASERPDCAFSLGAIEHGLGHCAQALAHYRKYRELAPQGEHISEVTAALEEVESRCGDASVAPAAPLAGGLSSGAAVPAGSPEPALPAAPSPSRAPQAPPEASTAPPRPHTELMLGSFVLSGAAAASSLVFGVLAAQTAHDCAQPRMYDQSFIEQCEEQGPTYQTLWQGFAVASGALLGVGLTVWWLDSNAAASVGVSAAGYPTLEYQGRF